MSKNNKFSLIGDIAKEVKKSNAKEVEASDIEEIREPENNKSEENDNQSLKEPNKFDSKEGKKNRTKVSRSDYYSYKNFPVSKSMQGGKYKVNFSLSEDAVQKIQYIQAIEGVNIREYSKIAELAISLLYDIKYKTSDTVTDKDSIEILKSLGIEIDK